MKNSKILRKISFILIIMIVMSGALCLSASADEIQTFSESVCVMEEQTGMILYSENSDMKCYPASTTKLLTALIVLENADLDDTLVFSENACDVPEGYTALPASIGEEMKVLDCLYGMMVMSANDCASALAEYVGGSIENFADMMNQKAKELGCLNSHFISPYGRSDPDHYSTAYDMCLIGRAAYENELIVRLCSTLEYTIPPTNMSDERQIASKNKLFDKESEYYNEHVLASKSGYLDTGRCTVTKAEIGDTRVIISCMHSLEYYGVFDDTNNVIDYLLANPVEIPTETESEEITTESKGGLAPAETTIEIETEKTTLPIESHEIKPAENSFKWYFAAIPALVVIAAVVAVIAIKSKK